MTNFCPFHPSLPFCSSLSPVYTDHLLLTSCPLCVICFPSSFASIFPRSLTIFVYFCAIHPSSCLSSCSPKCFSLVCPTVSALSALVHSFLIIISSDTFCHGEPASPFQRGFPVTEQVSDGAEHTSTPSSTWCVAMVTAADKALPH